MSESITLPELPGAIRIITKLKKQNLDDQTRLVLTVDEEILQRNLCKSIFVCLSIAITKPRLLDKKLCNLEF